MAGICTASVKLVDKDDAVLVGVEHPAGKTVAVLTDTIASKFGLEPSTLHLFDVTHVTDSALRAKISCSGRVSRKDAIARGRRMNDGLERIKHNTLLLADGEPKGAVRGAAHGGGLGSSSITEAFKQLPDGRMPQLFDAILNSAVIGIYDGKTPVSTAVFFSPTRALTVYHDAEPKVGDELKGASAPNVAPVRRWTFKVVASSPKDDLVVLKISTGPTPSHFLPLPPAAKGSIVSIRRAEVWLATFGISAARMAAERPMDISLGSYTDKTRIAACGDRHFVYHSSTGRGDSGGAIISLAGQLMGLHLGGWNDASPPPSPEDKGAGSSSAGAAIQPVASRGGKQSKKRLVADFAAHLKNVERTLAMGLKKVGSNTRKSILKLAKQLAVGGYAIYLGSPAVAALCHSSSGTTLEASSSSSAAAAGFGAAGKRKAGTAGLGHEAPGGKRRK